MSIDPRLLEILCCPATRVPVRTLEAAALKTLNNAIAEGTVLNVDGKQLSTTVAAALITQDGKLIYRIEDDIPVMLAEEAIGTAQFDNFPQP